MSRADWNKVKQIFHEALKRNTAERDAFVASACDGDAELKGEVETLLLSLAEARSFLEAPVVNESSGATVSWRLLPGTIVSHFEIIELLGSGGMGEVYLAEDARLKRKVALKILPAEVLGDETRLLRFRREATAVSALNHPNILTIYEFGEHDGLQFFATEFVDGQTLRRRLSDGPIAVNEAVDIASQVAGALEVSHRSGIIHRDIKPENIMIRSDGIVKVLDFGLARQSASVIGGEAESTILQGFSLPGTIMGTVTYMSPEQVRGMPVDEKTDIFALGGVLYEMLTGRSPFDGDSTADVIAKIIQIDPERPSSINEDVPAELDDIVSRSLSKRPEDRFETPAQLIATLRQLSERGDALSVRHNGQYADISTPKDGMTTSLPDLSPLVGRRDELAKLSDLLLVKKHRLVTLTGIGGTGKTRLAMELCRKVADHFANGFAFVRLGEVNDVPMVPSVIAQQLGIQEIVGRAIKDTLLEALAKRNMLLVLDNFEQIMSAAPFVGEIIAATENISIVITSRQRLNLQAEVEFDVPPLPVPDDALAVTSDSLEHFDSVKLFVGRARHKNPSFTLTDDNAPQVAKIVSMLDGLPLAIELAAAKVRLFSVDVIVEKLEQRLSFLTGGAIDLPARQRTLRAAVEWSYDLLNDHEKQLFRRLSVFGCRFTAQAAESVVVTDHSDDGAEFLDTFASLADKSLLYRRYRQGGEVTYSLLEIVREYAAARLESDDDAEITRRRHAEYYLDFLERAEPLMISKDTATWVNAIDSEHDNIRVALDWSLRSEPVVAARLAAAMKQFWLIRGHYLEALNWSERILDTKAEIPAEIELKLLSLCGNIQQFQGHLDEALEYYERSLKSARATGNEKFISQALRGVGALSYLRNDLAAAREFINEAIELSKWSGDDFGLAAGMARLGDISSVEGDLDSARSLTSDALTIFRRIGYLEGVSAKLYNLGAIEFLAGQHDIAQRHFEEAYTTLVELGEKINTRLIFDGFAALACEHGKYSIAARLAGVADSLSATIGYAIEPAEQRFRSSYRDKLRAAMNSGEFETEYEAGMKLSLNEARELVAASNDK